MKRIAKYCRGLMVACILLSPADTLAQGRNAAEILRTLPLDSLSGAITVYYSPGHAERARALQPWYGGALAHYRQMFAGDSALTLTTSLAILEPGHWSAFTPMPYGVPHIDFTGWPHLIAALPAANDSGLMADVWRNLGLTSSVELARVVDVIGFHEFGHSLNVQYLYVLAPETEEELSVHWFDEFMATYFGQGYLWHTEGLDADPIRAELVASLAPRSTTLVEFDEHYSQLFLTPEGFANLGWYQTQFAERAREVFAKQGLEFIRRVRDELPWDRYAEWDTDDLLQWLERIEPGFVAWAQALGR